LIEVPKGYYVEDGKEYLLDERALNAFLIMTEAANVEDIELRALSAYRSNDYQNNLYENYKARDGQELADKYSARPGHSEHQTGLAIDINSVSVSFEDSVEYKWLAENAFNFGFILRYPNGKEDETGYMYEPWHYRYVGVNVAKKIHEEGITFDAYYAKYLINKN